MQLVEVVTEGTAALRPQPRAQHDLGHKRIAIAVAADPAAYAQEGGEAIRERHAHPRELVFEVGVKSRQF